MSHIFDTFPINDELEMLECRLYELRDIPNLTHVAVEGDVTHQGKAKPYHLSEAIAGGRFADYLDRIIVVRATNLPTVADAPDPWAREYATREHCATGIIEGGVEDDDVVLHGDLDEVPRPIVVRNLHPRGMVALEMVGLFWAIDWRYGPPWMGTVATTAGRLTSFCDMRDARSVAPRIPDAGWHMSWIGGAAVAMSKVGSFCHPEVRRDVVAGIASGRFITDGYHLDGMKLQAVDVDDTWPRYVRDGLCPRSWFRPR